MIIYQKQLQSGIYSGQKAGLPSWVFHWSLQSWGGLNEFGVTAETEEPAEGKSPEPTS